MTSEGVADTDEDAVLRFVERFAVVLEEAGFPRMAARVFGVLLATDSARLTAAELARRLRVSPAAISGAVRFLIQLNLVSREREPGSRRDVYSLYDNVWYRAGQRDEVMSRWAECLREGLGAVDPDSPAGLRLRESLEYVQLVREEMPKIMDRWQERRAALRAQWGVEP